MGEGAEYQVTIERGGEIADQLPLPTLTEIVPLTKAHGRILASPLASRVDDPAFDNSAMDGFAVRTEDTQDATPKNPITLKRIAQVTAAAHTSLPNVEWGECVSIMTGAPIPPSTDGIIPVEDVVVDDEGVRISHPATNRHVRKQGENIKRGEVLLPAGAWLDAPRIGLCATMGWAEVEAIKRVKVAILVTGDELAEPGETLKLGQIYDSNSWGLAALVREMGHEPVRLHAASDDWDSMRDALDEAARVSDVIITSGGVSMGETDVLRAIIEKEGELLLWKMLIRPGSPPIVGRWKERALFGLPGNPVSSHVVFRMLVKPWLMRKTGADGPVEKHVKVILKDRVKGTKDSVALRRIFVEMSDEGLIARSPTHQGSGNLHSLVVSNALTLLPPGMNGEPEDLIEAILL